NHAGEAAKAFAEYYEEAADENGKKALALHVVKKYIGNFLKYEKETIEKLAAKKQFLTVKNLEVELRSDLTLSNGTTVTISGKSDRIDDVNGTLRIIDYKSSVNKARDKFEIGSLEEVFGEKKFSKALQLLTYAWLAWKNKMAPAGKISSCIIPFRAEEKMYELTAGKAPMVFTDGFFAEFEQKLTAFIFQMFDPATGFPPTEDLETCAFCAYRSICNRN
ncbi:MAG: RecB family exonuclease, partial [Bacteroidia bacterium]